ncbi:SRPBCC domain-containing protein [Paenibacillus sp. J5C_2022]|uniref:SRPBCC family protein n=1 Tax=Paenibacillus sp. J5C2022 TaxID=2977129 RepID=UPI0021D2594A|nr:SRPBCC domain-containing protein [Paenibacillus sp. J5C2022]MCU6708531.1 SRPBCC domain-containing protein [Paenibacillus sp. J5C2022]
MSVVVVHRYNAPAEKVFDAWLDPYAVVSWMFPDGQIGRVDIDAREGGSFSFIDLRDDVEIDHRGEYLVIAPPKRLVFTWGIPKESPDFDRVAIDIEGTETGCEVTLTYDLDPKWAEYAPQSEKAWRTMLEAIDKALTRH